MYKILLKSALKARWTWGSLNELVRFQQSLADVTELAKMFLLSIVRMEEYLLLLYYDSA